MESAPYVIAEVGQNHQGSEDLALQYIREFSACGADAIKFQLRTNRKLFSKEAYDQPYTSEMSFGATYGEHREFLELQPQWLPRLRQECRDCEVDFILTAFDEDALSIAVGAGVDAIKVASFDLGNTEFLRKVGSTGLPVLLSTGGGHERHIRASVDALESQNSSLSLLHCVSQYPCPPEKLSLLRISQLITQYPSVRIGLSDHFSGTLSGPLAYMLGARVFEKHVTLNRAWKGSDHAFSLEPQGFRKFTRDILRVDQMLEIQQGEDLGNEPVFSRLGKSITARTDIHEGTPIEETALTSQVHSRPGIPVREMAFLVGKIARRTIASGHVIMPEDVHLH